jgi:hypothetical protein
LIIEGLSLFFPVSSKEIAGDCWNVEKHHQIQPMILAPSTGTKSLLKEGIIHVFPHFNNRRLKVLWECGKVGRFYRLFQVLCVSCGKTRICSAGFSTAFHNTAFPRNNLKSKI